LEIHEVQCSDAARHEHGALSVSHMSDTYSCECSTQPDRHTIAVSTDTEE
jgi:hypothetical protein